MTIEVEKEDIRKIGNVWSNEDGFVTLQILKKSC